MTHTHVCPFSPHKKMSERKKRVYIVTYRLPVILHKHCCGRWSARWVADDITSRTPGSIAGVVQTQWIGVVSRECMDAGTLAWVSGEGGCTSPVPSTYQAPIDSGGAALGLEGSVAGGMEGGPAPLSWASLLPPMAALYSESGPEVVDPGVRDVMSSATQRALQFPQECLCRITGKRYVTIYTRFFRSDILGNKTKFSR